jgi:hypothetical protein
MPDFLSGARTVQADTDDHILDLAKGLDYLNQEQDGIALLKLIGTNNDPVKSYKHEWTQTQLAGRGETVTLADDTGTSLTVADANAYTTDELLRIEDEVVRVSAIANDTTLTIVRAQAGTTGAAHAAKHAIRIGVAREENSTAGTSVTSNAAKLYNYVQTFDRPVELSTHEIAQLSTRQGNPFEGQLEERFIEINQQLARAVFYGVRYEDTSAKRYFMGGLKQFVTTNVTNAAAASLSLDMIDDIIQAQVDAGALPTTMVMGTIQKRKLDALDASLVRTGKETRVGGNPITQTWQSGVLKNPLNVIVDHSILTDEVWILDHTRVSVHPMMNNGAGHAFKLVNATAQGQDGKKTRILGHYTMKVQLEKAHGYIRNLAVS